MLGLGPCEFEDSSGCAILDYTETNEFFANATNAQLFFYSNGTDVLNWGFEYNSLQIEAFEKNAASFWITQQTYAAAAKEGFPNMGVEYPVVALSERNYGVKANGLAIVNNRQSVQL